MPITINGGTTTYATIQDAIDAAGPGDTINVGPGTYNLTSTLNVNEQVTIEGSGEGATIINAALVTGYGILVTANSVTIEGVTVFGPATAGNDRFGIKVQPEGSDPSDRLSDFTLTDVTVQNSGRSEIDLNGVDGATLTNVTANGFGTAGAGIAITDSADITLTDITTAGNAWGSVALYNANRFYDQATGNITFSGSYSAGETIKIFAQDNSNGTTGDGNNEVNGTSTDLGTVTLPADHSNNHGFQVKFTPGAATSATYFFATEADADAFIALLSVPQKAVALLEDPDGNWLVKDGMSIQAAIDAADAGDTISVSAGTFNEHLTIDKALTIEGANAGVNPSTGTRVAETVLTDPAGGADQMIKVSADDVTIKGFTLQGTLGETFEAISSWNGPGLFDYDTIDRLTVQDNIIDGIGSSDTSLYGYAIDLGSDGTGAEISSGSVISGNLFTNMPNANGVILYGNAYADIQNNVFQGVENAIYVGNQWLPDEGSARTISGNQIVVAASGTGIIVNNNFNTPSTMTVTDNNVTDDTGTGTNGTGILIWSLQDSATVIVTNNDVTGMTTGIEVWNAAATITGGMLDGNAVGIRADNQTIYGDQPASVTVEGTTISNSSTAGVMADDTGTSGQPATVTFSTASPPTLTGNAVDALVTGTDGAFDPGSGILQDLRISGDASDNALRAGAGDDTIDGGDGNGDTLVLSGDRADYTVTDNLDGTYTVTDTRGGSPDGTDTVTNLEFLAFSDQMILVELAANNTAPTGIAFTGAVDENVAGVVVGTAVATDPDTGLGDTITYNLTDDADGRFSIDANTGAVTIVTAADAEADQTLDIIVRATDSGGLFVENTVSVTINDVEEFALSTIADDDVSTNEISENAAIYATVGITALATDGDISDTVTYTLDDDADGLFDIDGNSGVVTLMGTLDAETSQAHTIVVRAETADGGIQTQTFTIDVLDVDEFSMSAVTDDNPDPDTVAEDAAVGTEVGVTGLAQDQDATATITYSLDDNAGGRFAIDATTGIVTVAGALDFETDTSHVITIRAESSQGDVSTYSTTINVQDVSEGTVSAISDADEADEIIAENVNVGDFVGVTAFATDPDGSDVVTYTLDDDAGDIFAIDSVTGVVTIASTEGIDFESDQTLSFTVQAESTDGSTSQQSYTVTVTDFDEFDVSTILDTNEVANDVSEDAVSGTEVGITAFAQDDDGTTNTVTYSLTDDSEGLFAIDTDTGVVTLAGTLDAETATSHDIEVTATSADGSTSVQTFTINVLDADDADVSTPVDVDGTDNTIAENAVNGTLVGITAAATDSDLTNNTVTYSLVGGTGEFAIDANTGIVSVAGNIDREAGATRTITVRATSSDGSMAEADFTIDVTDTDEFDVSVPLDANSVSDEVAEGAAIGTLVGVTAQATDADATNNGVTYGLVGDGAGNFSIDANTGVVTTAVVFDRETAPTQSFTVQATSADGSTELQTFTIDITNVNEAPDAGDTTATTAEDSAVVIDVASLIGDVDGDTLTVTASSPNGSVSVSGTEITFTPNANFNGPATVSYTVTDPGGLTGTGEIAVTVAPVQDAPVAVDDDFSTNEDAFIDIPYASLTANDTDPDGDALTVTGVGSPVNGSVALLPGNIIRFTPAADFVGVASFTYTVSDGHGGQDTGLVSIDVTAFANTINVTLTSGPNTYVAPTNDNYNVSALGGNDSVTTSSGNDTINGSTGQDTINSGSGNDVILFGSGNLGFDVVDAGLGFDTLRATANDGFIGLTSVTGIEEIDAGGLSGVRLVMTANGDLLDLTGVTVTGSVVYETGNGSDTVTGTGGADIIDAGKNNDTVSGGAGDDIFRVGAAYGTDTYDGGADQDTIVATAANVVLSVTTGSLASIETISSGGFADFRLLGTTAAETLDFSGMTMTGVTRIDGNSGNDAITGTVGDDVIAGGAGRDTVTGGDGADIFDFDKTTDSRGTTADIITDFDVLLDKIDLDTIDADTGTSGNQDFTFIGTAAFTGAGQVRIDTTSTPGVTKVLVNTNSSTAPDMEIQLTGLLTLDADNFNL
jgi:Ca2+-binding RTX toxin-like protein